MISGQLKEADYLAAQSLHNTWSNRKRLLILGGSALLALIAALLLRSKHGSIGIRAIGGGAIGGLIGGWTWGFIVRYFYIPWKARRIFRQLKNIQRPFEISWNSEALTGQNANGKHATPWSDFIRWKENDCVFLLYLSDVSFHMGPKRIFENAESIQEFRQLLQQKISPKPFN